MRRNEQLQNLLTLNWRFHESAALVHLLAINAQRILAREAGSLAGFESMDDREERIAWFKAEILPFEPVLRAQLRRMLASPAEVDDFASEALTRAYAVADFSRIAGGRNYLLTIAHNLVRDAARRARIVSFETIADLDLLDISDDSPNAERVVTARDEMRHLSAAVDALPPRSREVFLLRRIEGLSTSQVAEQLGISVSAIEKHLANALAHLAQALADQQPVDKATIGSSWRIVRHRR